MGNLQGLPWIHSWTLNHSRIAAISFTSRCNPATWYKMLISKEEVMIALKFLHKKSWMSLHRPRMVWMMSSRPLIIFTWIIRIHHSLVRRSSKTIQQNLQEDSQRNLIHLEIWWLLSKREIRVKRRKITFRSLSHWDLILPQNSKRCMDQELAVKKQIETSKVLLKMLLLIHSRLLWMLRCCFVMLLRKQISWIIWLNCRRKVMMPKHHNEGVVNRGIEWEVLRLLISLWQIIEICKKLLFIFFQK